MVKKEKNNEVVTIADEDLANQESELFLSLHPRHQRFVHLWCSGAYKVPDIAQVMGLHPNTIRYYLRNDKIKRCIDEFQREENDIVNQRLKKLRTKAIDELTNVLDSPQDAIKLQAIIQVLDRTGHKAVQEKNINVTHKTIEQHLIDASKSNDFIDVTSYEVLDADED